MERAPDIEERALRPALPSAPRTVADTGLAPQFLGELLAKVLLQKGRSSVADLCQHLRLSLPVVEALLTSLRQERLCECQSRGDTSAATFFQLTEHGSQRALDYMRRNQYAGVAPVSLIQYEQQLERQSIRNVLYTREGLAQGFAGVVMRQEVLDRIGAALNSGRALILYGPAGAGKTYLAEHLAQLAAGDILIPWAVEIDSEVVQVFDPHMHIPADGQEKGDGKTQADGRWMRCRRPVVIAGGELTLNMLDLEFDEVRRHYQAPAHVKANGGVFVVDDLGRQQVSPRELMNRWIVPLDRRMDFLTLHTGYKFRMPFDVVVVFSSNQHPTSLADGAFLRRLGYKIELGELDEPLYRQVFLQCCERLQLSFDESAYARLLQLHRADRRGLFASCPRDILGQLRDRARYEQQEVQMTPASVEWAWRNFFPPAANADGQRLEAQRSQS